MAVKIRLSRHGKKNHAFFHIVVADSRSPRDGRLIEQIGLYNPNTNPATIILDFEKALSWLNKGAQPTDTTRRILSYEGVLLKKHLQGGVTKGALTQEAADKKWNAWKAEKDAKLASKKQTISNADVDAKKSAVAAEAKVNSERAEAIAKRKQEEEAKKAAEAAKAAEEAAAAAAAAQAEAAATETPAETPAETAPKANPEA
ncbi:MAG: 30S ribosomal protein S16 [Bacteroidales bacterium]|nr:30S ribosomal protein S16 [Bacteroidales bacterium]MDD3201764.1 30S ribosomal protein S16 [Bacteroidales bacterium]